MDKPQRKLMVKAIGLCVSIGWLCITVYNLPSILQRKRQAIYRFPSSGKAQNINQSPSLNSSAKQ